MISLIVTKKQCFALQLEDTFFEKPQERRGGGGGLKLTAPSYFRVNQYCQYLNLPQFNQSSLSNQLFLDWLVQFLNLYVDCIGLFGFIQLEILFSYVISMFSALSLIFFMRLTPYIYVKMFSQCKLNFTHRNQHSEQAVKE